VSAPEEAAATADPTELGAGALGPKTCAHLLEDGERLLQRLARLATPLRSPLSHAERKERPAAVERNLDPRVPLERARVCGERSVDLSGLGGE